MAERVIAIDPGDVHVGWACAVVAENSLTEIAYGVTDPDEFAVRLARQQSPPAEYLGHRYDVLVVETFRPVRKHGSMDWIEGDELLTPRLIGKIELIAELSGAKLVAQEPSRKPVGMASMPSALADRPISTQHDADALIHLWLYAFDNWVTDPRKLVIE